MYLQKKKKKNSTQIISQIVPNMHETLVYISTKTLWPQKKMYKYFMSIIGKIQN